MENVEKEFTPEERLKYLQEKKVWLESRGMQLRKNRLIEMINLMNEVHSKDVDDNGEQS